MTIIIEIFTALFFLFVSGSVHSTWQTNPILKHPAGRFFIATLVIAGILGWHFYPTSSVSDEEIELKFWQSVEKDGSQKSYCAYLDKYPQGQFVDLSQPKCHPVNVNIAIQQGQAVASQSQKAWKNDERIADYTKLQQITEGMTKLQVKQLVGLPSMTNGDGNLWFYNIKYPDTGKIKVCNIFFNPEFPYKGTVALVGCDGTRDLVGPLAPKRET